MSNTTISIATVNDAKELLEIYRPYVEKTAITFEYDVPALKEFELRIENTLKKYPYLIARIDGEIVGYAYASAFKSRRAYDWAIETSIYVKWDKHSLGVGKALYQALEKALKLMNIINVNACITYTEVEDEYLTNNSPKFHQHLGYRLVGRFEKCGYKFNKWYDMIWMEKFIGQHNVPPLEVIPFPQIKDQLINEL